MKRKLVSALLVAAMSVSLLAGCGEAGAPVAESTGNTNVTEETANSNEATATEGAAAEEVAAGYVYPETLDNADLVIVWDTTEDAWNATLAENPDAFNLVWTTKKAFEEKYGGNVEVIGVGWGDQMSQVIDMVNAGETCDLAQAHDQNFPIYGAKNIVQDISQYIDLNDGFWYDSVTNAFTFGGVHYAAGADAAPVVISYNKTLFDEYGVKTPMEYFEEGNWTWDTFREVALNMTGDTDGDGELDVYGFGWWDSFYVQMLNANGTTGLAFNADGTVGSNYLSKEATEAFTFLQDAYMRDKFIMRPDGDNFISAFKGGKLAMTCEYGFAAITAYACDYDIEWAPLPQGPSGEKYECGGSLSGFAIPTTSANPEGAAVFARMAYELLQEYNNTARLQQYDEKQVDLMNTLAAHINFSPIGIEKYWDANWTIFSGLIEGTPVSTFATTADEQIVEGAKQTLEN